MQEKMNNVNCPYCGEEILATAKKCKHCGEWLEKDVNVYATSTPKPISIENAPPKNWLVKSILVTIFCFWPLGIAAIVNAVKVNTLFAAGNVNGANEAAKKAKKWTKITFFVGIGFWILMIVWIIFVLRAANAYDYYDYYDYLD